MIENDLVLVLNRSWQAIGVKPLHKAIKGLAAGTHKAVDMEFPIVDGQPDYSEYIKCDAIDWADWVHLPIQSYDSWITTPKVQIRFPTVVITKNYDKMPMIRPRLTKRAIWIRDNGICQVSGKALSYKNGSVDHIIPKHRGGKDTWENLALMDLKLNNLKGNKTIEEMGWKLLKKPNKVNAVPALVSIKKTHPSWTPFLRYE
jgi:5-methylcytosine-specific restriction endonuclease McrA